MLVGHVAVGLAAKRVEPSVSIGTTVTAAMLADLLWCLFWATGLEQVRIAPALGAANYFIPERVDLSHSLAMDVVWAALFGLLSAWRSGRRAAWLLVAVVLSHWALDAVSWRPFLPLAPGLPERIGLGLWASIPATLIVEGGAWIAALVVYARTTCARSRAGVYAFWPAAVILTIIWYNNIAGPPPPDPKTAPVASFVFFSLVI